jgi:rRNA small subunit pseudouridine methyltransferase Nep1
MGIILIIVESALELVPESISRHNAVLRHARSRGKEPTSMILDRSYHHVAMLKLKDAYKRGRPDILHFTLLEATTIPLYFKSMLDVYVHTIDDKVIEVGKNVRLPKNYNRFVGLMEDLYSKKVITNRQGYPLLVLKESTIDSLIDRVNPSIMIGLSRYGVPKGAEYVACSTAGSSDACIVIGGFPRGTFRESTTKLFTEMVSISDYSLEAHVVAARVLYEVEKAMGIR